MSVAYTPAQQDMLYHREHATREFVKEPRSRQHGLTLMEAWLRCRDSAELAQHGFDAKTTMQLRCDPIAAVRESRAMGTASGAVSPGEIVFAEVVRSMSRTDPMLALATVVAGDGNTHLRVAACDDTGNPGGLLAENTQDTEEDAILSLLKLGHFKYTSKRIRFSLELDADGEAFVNSIAAILGERIGRITNAHFTVGTGTGQPTGVVTAATNSTIVAAGVVPTRNELFDLQFAVNEKYHDSPTCGYMMASSTWAAIAKEGTASNPVYAMNFPIALANGSLSRNFLHGHPVFINPAMPAGTGTKAVLFGDYGRYFIRMDRDWSLSRFREMYAENFQTAYSAVVRADGGLADTKAVAYLTLG